VIEACRSTSPKFTHYSRIYQSRIYQTTFAQRESNDEIGDWETHDRDVGNHAACGELLCPSNGRRRVWWRAKAAWTEGDKPTAQTPNADERAYNATLKSLTDKPFDLWRGSRWKSAALKRIADAGTPLYQSLDDASLGDAAAMRRTSSWVRNSGNRGGFLPTSRVIVPSITGHLSDLAVAGCWRILVDWMAKGLQGLFLASRYAAGAALLVMVAWLPGCSDVALPSEEMPASGPDLSYNKLVANYLKSAFKNRASYDAFVFTVSTRGTK
jgi:hypothetical protein